MFLTASTFMSSFGFSVTLGNSLTPTDQFISCFKAVHHCPTNLQGERLVTQFFVWIHVWTRHAK